MGVQDPLRLTLGEWSSMVSGWNRAHGGDGAKSEPPSVDEFEAAVMAVRGGADGAGS